MAAPEHVSTRFGEIAYRDRGTGPDALFVHGVTLNGALWDNLVDRVHGERRCLAVDLLAHGATVAPADQDLSFAANAAMLEAFCQALGLGRVDVVANDSGGGIAQIFAARHPGRIRTLTLTNCDTHDNWPPPAFQPVVDAVAAGGLAEFGRAVLADPGVGRAALAGGYEDPERLSDEAVLGYFEPLVRTPRAIAAVERWFAAMDCADTVAVEALLRRLDAPTLIVWGLADDFFDVTWAHWLHDTIPGARPVVELDGAKLFFPDERPDELAEILARFWASTAA